MAAATLTIAPGGEVEANGRRYLVLAFMDADSVLGQDPLTGEKMRLYVRDVRPVSPEVEKADSIELALIDDAEWHEAQRRFSIIQPLLENSGRRRADVAAAAKSAGAHTTTLYRWIADYETYGKVSALLPRKPNGGRGKSRMPDNIETIISATIDDFYLQDQQRSVQATFDEVHMRCRNAGIPPPHISTVRRRIAIISEETRLRRRANRKRADDRFNARPGEFQAEWPLHIVQIDHTKLGIECVDEVSRRPIGRPWLTLAIDVYSRAVVGFYLSLDPPGDAGTGLCLSHAILPKEVYLARLGLSTSWSVWGVPTVVHADNAKEFRGKMLMRAGQEYGFNIEFRPVKTPHYGAHIERLMGTFSTEIKKWPGTTFSNPQEKAEYDSGEHAAYTLTELEKVVTEFITGVYHERLHSGIGMSPRRKYDLGLFGDGSHPAVGFPRKVVDEDKLRLDFMPFVERTIQSYGTVVDEIHYYHDVMRPYINVHGKARNRKFLFRRDPRDISTIYFHDPELKQYTAVPYRNTSYPAMSKWELREVQAAIRREGRESVNEAAIFESLARMRALEDQAVAETRKKRRGRQRRVEHAKAIKPKLEPPTTSFEDVKIALPDVVAFEDLREL